MGITYQIIRKNKKLLKKNKKYFNKISDIKYDELENNNKNKAIYLILFILIIILGFSLKFFYNLF